MIAGISSGFEGENDFDIFLTKNEIINLEKHTLEGTIIYFAKPTNLKYLKLSVNDKKTAKINFRKHKKVFLSDIVVEDLGTDKYHIFVSQYRYEKLKEIGSIGGRDGLHKIDIIEETLAEEGGIFYEEFGNDLKYLKKQIEI